MRWLGVATLLFVLCTEASPQTGQASIPFTAFGSPAQQRHRQLQQQQRQQSSRQGGARVISGFQFGSQVPTTQFGQPFTVFRQPAGTFSRPPQPQFGQFRPIPQPQPGFQPFAESSSAPQPSSVTRDFTTTERPRNLRPRPSPKQLFSFRISPQDFQTTTTTTRTTTTPIPIQTTAPPPDFQQNIRSNDVSIFEPTRSKSQFELTAPRTTTDSPVEVESTTVSINRGSRRFNGLPAEQFVTDSLSEPVATSVAPAQDSEFDYSDEAVDELQFETFTYDDTLDYTDQGVFTDTTESSLPSVTTAFVDIVSTTPRIEFVRTTRFPAEVGSEPTTDASINWLNEANTEQSSAPERTTVEPASSDVFLTPIKQSVSEDEVSPIGLINTVNEFDGLFLNDSTEPSPLDSNSGRELQSLDVTAEKTEIIATTAAPLAAVPTLSSEEFTTAITAPPTNRVSRETTPVAVRPTRPSFPRRGLSASFRDRVRNRNRNADIEEEENQSQDSLIVEESTVTPVTEMDEAPTRRLSLRERLLQATQSKVASVPSTEEPKPEIGATARKVSETNSPSELDETSTSSPGSRRFSPPTRRPLPRAGGGARGGLASLLVKQLKDDSGATEALPNTESTTQSASTSTASTTIVTTTEATEPSNTGRKAPSRGGLAAILSSKSTSDRAQRPGLSSLIEKLRGRTSTTESAVEAERDAKALRVDGDRQRPRRPIPRQKTTTTESFSEDDDLEVIQDDVAAFLPPGFKPLEDKAESTSEGGVVIIEEDINPDLLPDGFKEKVRADLENSNSVPSLTPPPSTSSIKAEPVEDLSSFLPPGFQLAAVSTTTSDKKAEIIQDDVSALLPPSYKLSINTTEEPRGPPSISDFAEEVDDISAFLPPGFKVPSEASTTTSKPDKPDLSIIAEEEDVSAFLPPGYKAPSDSSTEQPDLSSIAVEEDVSSFLPPGYRPSTGDDKPKIAVIEADVPASFLPPGYKPGATGPPASEAPKEPTSTTTKAPAKSGGIVFPGGRQVERDPLDLSWLPKSSTVPPRPILIPDSEDGLFSRLNNRPKFTGWPKPVTQPTVASVDGSSASGSSSGSDQTRTTSTTTTRAFTTTTIATTTTTRRPTTPGVCAANCRMASSVRIVEGLRWRPELAIRGTDAWEDAADLVTLELTEAFQASKLNVWFDRVVIESFSRGSVIADYYLVFNKLIGELDTRDVNVLFTESLPPMTKEMEDGSERQLLRMGSLVIDPDFTDFVVQEEAKPIAKEEDNYLIPEWSIAVIVIGLTALLFMLIFGIVLMWNRRKRRARNPRTTVPLTADMLNELDKSHMAGVDNYGADDVYDPDDAWNNEKVTYDRRLRSASREKAEDYHNYNIYDSWRSDMSGPHGSAAGWSRKKMDNFDDDPDDF